MIARRLKVSNPAAQHERKSGAQERSEKQGVCSITKKIQRTLRNTKTDEFEVAERWKADAASAEAFRVQKLSLSGVLAIRARRLAH